MRATSIRKNTAGAEYRAPEAHEFRRVHRKLRLEREAAEAEGPRGQRRRGGRPFLELPGQAGRTWDLGPVPAQLKADRWFDLEFTFMEADGAGSYRAVGEPAVHLADHGMKMSQLMRDLVCDSLTQFQDLICKPRGSAEWLDGDQPLIEYPYIRRCREKKLPVCLQLVPRAAVVAEFQQLEEDSRLEHAVQRQIDMEQDATDRPPDDPRMDPDLPPEQWTCLPIWYILEKFRVTVVSCENVVLPEHCLEGKKDAKTKAAQLEQADRDSGLFLRMGVFHGGKNCVIDQCETSGREMSDPVHWDEVVETTTVTKMLPRATVLSFTLMYGKNPGGAPAGAAEDTAGDGATEATSKPPLIGLPVAWVNMHVFDHVGLLVEGRHVLKMWPALDAEDEANPINTCVVNLESINPILLTLDFEANYAANPRHLPICKYTWGADEDTSDAALRQPTSRIDEAKALKRLTESDPLYQPTGEEKALLYKFRHQLKTDPGALPKLMLAIDWLTPDQIREARRLLKQWAPLKPVQALDLLDARHADLRVREHAVMCMEKLSDAELLLYMPQMIQTLKYDPYHDSALGRFLIRRGLRSPELIGHNLFWYRLRHHVLLP